jgi:hypothetical protein
MDESPTTHEGSGPVGKARSKGLVILVSIVTFGIWTLVWSFQNGDELKAYRNEGIGGVLYLILTLLLAPITMFLMADEVDKMYQEAGEQSPISALWGLWFLLPFIGNIVWYVKIQNSLNDFWTARGAAAPSGL